MSFSNANVSGYRVAAISCGAKTVFDEMWKKNEPSRVRFHVAAVGVVSSSCIYSVTVWFGASVLAMEERWHVHDAMLMVTMESFPALSSINNTMDVFEIRRSARSVWPANAFTPEEKLEMRTQNARHMKHASIPGAQ